MLKQAGSRNQSKTSQGHPILVNDVAHEEPCISSCPREKDIDTYIYMYVYIQIYVYIPMLELLQTQTILHQPRKDSIPERSCQDEVQQRPVRARDMC